MKIPQQGRLRPAFPVPRYRELFIINENVRRLFKLTAWRTVLYFDWPDNPEYQPLRDDLAERFK